MASASSKSGFLVAFFAMLFAVLVLVPAADAFTCATDPIADHTHTETVEADRHDHAHGHDTTTTETQHGACAHGHTHNGPGARIDAPVTWAMIAPDKGLPILGLDDKWAPFAPDALERPPRG